MAQEGTTALDDEWISTKDAAALLRVSESTVYRSLKDETIRAEQWGPEGTGWRRRPLLRRRIYEVSRKRVEELVGSNASDD